MLPTTALAIAANDIHARKEDVKKASAISDVLRWYYQMKKEYDEFDEQRKRVYEALEDLSRKVIPEMMAEEGVKTITLEDIRIRFTVSQRFTCSMPDKEGGMNWLRENGLGDLIQETVNSGTLSSAAKKRIEEDGLEMPALFFNTSTSAFTSATAVK